MKYWYAVLSAPEDADWGYGSFDLEVAKGMASRYPGSCIAVINANYDENGNAQTDGECIAVICLP